MMLPIYMRNIYLILKEQRGEQFKRRQAKILFYLIGAGCLAFALNGLLAGDWAASRVPNPDTFTVPFTALVLPGLPVLALGFAGIMIFNGRFLLQWMATERAKRSVVPDSFWVVGSIGSFMSLIYFAIRCEPIGVLGHITTLPPFLYNLALIRRTRKQRHGETGTGGDSD
jgi:lipid-A-disaccharide synthase-like uncharacterized protein